jgi:PAS domain S-box-containing protein
VRSIGDRPAGGCLIQVVDVTQAVHRERVLRERQSAQHKAVLDSAPDAILTLDTDGLIRVANPAAVKELGYQVDELIGRTFAKLFQIEEKWDPLWKSVLAGSLAQQALEVQARRKDGSFSYLEISASRWVSESRIFVTAILRNTNERRAAEEALRALNRTLERRVEERTAELMSAEEQLRQSQKMEAVGQLTGGVAHDFNNLLTIIRSSVEFLQRPNLPAERQRRYLDAIGDTVDRASKLTSQLLAFARRQALKPEVFDVAARVRAVLDMIRTISGARIQIVTESTRQPCFVEADLAQFETALVNMAVNARDAMNGEGRLTIRLSQVSRILADQAQGNEPRKFVAISLSDTGSGIAPDKLTRIFEPFFTTKEVGKGTGLGLSQVYGFAKQSGGDVDVASELGRGTTFTLYLPEVDGAVVMEGIQLAADRSQQPENGRGLRVLLVEDNVDVGQFSTELLQDLGYQMVWAADANEALRILEDEAACFDVVFSDVIMPGMNGVDLGHEIKRLYPGLPVILTSGYSHVLAEEGRHGFELLQKPYAAEEVSRVLQRVTRHDRTGCNPRGSLA